MRILTPLVLLSSILLACGQSGPMDTMPTADDQLTIPPAPANGMQIVLPAGQVIQPGTSIEMCTWTDKVLDHDIDIKELNVFQNKIGHHVVLFYTSKMQPAGTTRECTDDDMATFRFAAGSGEMSNTVAPGNLVFHIPAGVQLVLNHHYLNAGTTAMAGQSGINLTYADPGQNYTHVGNLAFLNTGFKIPPGAYSIDINCTMPRDEKIWQLFPHMHEWGVFTTIDTVIGGQTNRLVSQPWDPSYAFHPPEIDRDISNPIMLSTGDQVKVHCEWNNTTGKTMTFGIEMCVGFASTINDQNRDNIECDNGDWDNF